MKTRLFVLAIMLLSSASSALADTRKVDENHLQQHRENKSKLQKPSEKSFALKKKSSTKIKHVKVSTQKSSSILDSLVDLDNSSSLGPYYYQEILPLVEWDVYSLYRNNLCHPYFGGETGDQKSEAPPPPQMIEIFPQ